MIFCTSLKKCECKNSGLCNKPCKRPLCKPLCPCIEKMEDIKEEFGALKGDVKRNTQKIEDNYDQLNKEISDLAEIHAKDHRDVLKYIDDKDAENDSLLEQEIDRAKEAEGDLNAKIEKEIADRILDVNDEEDRAKEAERILDGRIDREIIDRLNGDVILHQDITQLHELHEHDIEDINDRLDDILGIDAAGLAELKAILSDDDTATGIIVELAKKADKSGVTAGTYKSVTVNSDGIVTAGTNPTTIAGYGITDAYTKDETDDLLDDKADKVLMDAGTYKSVTVNNQGIVTAGSNPTTIAGYGITDAYTKTETDNLLDDKADKSNVTAGDYTKVTVNSDGIVTAGDNPTTIAGYGITDAYTKTLTDNLLDGKANKSNVTADTYRSVTVNADGIVTAGTNPTTISDYGITDAKIEDGENNVGKKITLGNQNVTVYTKAEIDSILSTLTTQISTLLGYWSVNNDNRLTTTYIIEPYGYK